MWKSEEIFRKSVETAINHRARAREGKQLLKEGKTLNEMQTPITGLSESEMLERRQAYIDNLTVKSPIELENLLTMVEAQLKKREEGEEKGTSELNWQRLAILEKLGK